MPEQIVIGVTGHRDLRVQDIPRLTELIASELEKIKSGYPHTVMLNSLAAGADMLCAEEALKLGIKIVCPVPLPLHEYRKDFDGIDIIKFDGLAAMAEEIFTASCAEPAPPEYNRDYYYRQAGIYVAEHCDVLIALWDGSPAEKGGCGTAETVDYMMHGSRCSGAVIHIVTPRVKNLHNPEIRCAYISKKSMSYHGAFEIQR